jgi:hypothetical protein
MCLRQVFHRKHNWHFFATGLDEANPQLVITNTTAELKHRFVVDGVGAVASTDPE